MSLDRPHLCGYNVFWYQITGNKQELKDGFQ